MIKKILLILTIFMTLCISVCAESVSYDLTSKTVENTGSWAVIKKGEDLYFSGENNFVSNIDLAKGDKIILLKWNSYADIKPIAQPSVYTACTVDFMCENSLVKNGMSFLETEHNFPDVYQKTGYEVKWSYKQQGENHIVANAEYVIKDYTVTFKADGETVGIDTYNINNTEVSEPAVPKKEGYNGRWEDYTLTYGNKEVNAIYTPIEYTVTFESEKDVAKRTFNVESMSVEEPAVPEKAGYAAKWEDYTLTLSNITVKAVYELIEYEVTFEADGEAVSTEKYTVENKNITKPLVPEKTGYTGKWETYELNLENITVKAIYTPIEYKVTFKAENFEETKSYTVENKNVDEPLVPEKTGYAGKWESYELNLENISVNAVYTPIQYKVTFKAENFEEIKNYTIENKNVEEPKVPEKTGYTGKWESYSLNLGNITVNAVYTPIQYKVTFVAEGEICKAEVYTVENPAVDEPLVPEKTGYTGKWEIYELTTGDKTVNAVYSAKSFIISFDVNGGESLDITGLGEKYYEEDGIIKTEVTYDSEYGELPTPVHSDSSLEFAGWIVNSKPIGNVVAITEDSVFTAVWTDKPVYTVIYNNYYGEGQHRYSTVIEGQKADIPENPVKRGYEFAGWYTDVACTNQYDFSQNAQGEISLYPKWDVVTYTVKFISHGNEITENYTVENKNITVPQVTEKTGYTGEWESFTLENLGNITVNAVYAPIEYTVTFMADGKIISQKTYTIENLNIEEPSVPVKNGYNGKWENYSLNLENITVNAVYEIITYTVTFVADGETVATKTYTVEKPTVTKPSVPRKTGYNGKWEDYTLTYGDVTVNAVYTPVTYSVYFFDEDGVPVDVKTFTVENPLVDEPTVPEKTGYEGKWQEYKLGAGNVSVYPLYTIINYTVTFVADNETVSVQTYTYTNRKITEPSVPEKAGYTAKWEEYSLNLENITVKAVYTPIEYKVTFVAEQNIVEEVYTVENKHIYAPAVPQKRGYTAKWEEYSLNLENITVNAVYTPIEYTITFIADTKEISVQKFNVENMNIWEPVVPQKDGYTAKWENYSLDLQNINVKAVYELIEYTATFKIDGVVVSEQKFNVENMSVVNPQIPAKTGYAAKWENYELSLSDITVNAVYEPVTYTVNFMAGGSVVAKESYNIENMTINEPLVPEKAGYTGKWTDYSLNLKNITVVAVYTPIEYTAKFVVDGVEVSSQQYTVESGAISEPAVPEKEWYEGKWEEYSLGAGGVTISAVYTPAIYTISFKADGKEIGTQNYDINNQTVTLPAIPEKANHRAVWEKYEVVPGGMTINVRYISSETDAENAEELYHYSNLVTDLENTSQIGTEKQIIMNVVSVAKIIIADIDYGIVIEESYIKEKFGGKGGIIEETKALNATLTERKRNDLKRYVATTIKEEATYDYFLDFYDKYF